MYGRGNPFERRATEYITEGYDFVSVALPDPLQTFFVPVAKDNILFDRLVLVIGTPGSGKTTIAKLLQYNHVTVVQRADNEELKHTRDVLRRCDVLAADGTIRVLGCRLPLEGEYRDFWNLPYQDDLKARLMYALMQSRAVLLWLRYLEQSGESLERVNIIARDPEQAAVAAIGGTNGVGLRLRAAEVERTIYSVVAALVPPREEVLTLSAIGPYEPFDVIDSFVLEGSRGATRVKPLVMMDDAHTLHPVQHSGVQRWLARREIRVARWLLMRCDALTTEAVLEGDRAYARLTGEATQIDNPDREVTEIWLQSDDRRGQDRLAFRKLARSMASRYLRQMPIFRDRGQRDLAFLLSESEIGISEDSYAELQNACETMARRFKISPARVSDLRQEAQALAEKRGAGRDLALGVFRILLNRYKDRVPQVSLIENLDAEPARPLAIDDVLLDAAAIQLFHEYDRPYYYGISDVADASSENAEEFLRLAAELVGVLEASAIRGRTSEMRPLSALRQHKILRESASSRIARWNFPEVYRVRRLADAIARRCQERTLAPSAPLNSGANAIGIRESEFAALSKSNASLARVLHYGVANNAFSLKRGHSTKNDTWCLVNLSGILCLKYGLTLKRGGFIDNVGVGVLSREIEDGDVF